MTDIFSYFLCNSQTNNEAKEERKKKRKIVKSRKDKQKVTGSKIKTLGRNTQKKSIAIKIMEKSQPYSKVQTFGLPL